MTPDTSPVDLLYSSANLMTHQFDPRSSIVVECYFSFGLERRLRRYERIRDVLNSWERDSQHSLLIIPNAPTDRNADLTIESVPRSDDAPPGFSNVSLHHSQRPGRWSKRLITLLGSGQLFSHKKPNAKPSDKDSTAFCNLSDFDIYQVTEEDMLKHIRPPRKHVFAVKSQQKSSVFLNTENFIHFLSTDDDAVARNVQTSIHSWRSWYLVNRKVDLAQKEKAQQLNGGKQVVRTGHHRLKVSVDETPYTIGTFSPLLDLERFNKPMEEFGKDFLPQKDETETDGNAISQPLAHRTDKITGRPREATDPGARAAATTTSPPTLPLSPKSPEVPTERVAVFSTENEFKTSGLLGKTYADRKLQAERKSIDEPVREGPFTGGLLQQHQALSRQSSTKRSDRGYATRGSASPPMRQPNTTPLDEPAIQGPFTGGLLQKHATDQQTRRVGRSNTTTSRPPTSSATAQPSGTGATGTARPLARSMTNASSRPTTSDGASYGKQRERPGPLLDVAPKMPQIPSYWRNGHGHGVKAPTGVPLINMATDTRPGIRQPGGKMSAMISPPTSPPPTGLARRATTKTTQSAQATTSTSAMGGGRPRASSSSRPRSQSANTASAGGRRYASHEKPPAVPAVPAIPSRTPPVRSTRRRDDEDVPLINFVDRTRSRDPSRGRAPDPRSRSGATMG